ncbi:MAG: hypothetical protein AB8G23_14250 [Myxococcota bacterium]
MPDRFRHLCLRFAAVFLILWTPFFSFSAYRGHPVPIGSLVYSASLFAIPAFLLALLAGHERRYRYVGVFSALVLIFLDVQFSWMQGLPAVVALLAVVAAFWALRGNLALILTTIFATMLASTMLTPSRGYEDNTLVVNQEVQARPLAAPDSRAPANETFIHIILDEFIGVEGIPEEVEGARTLKRQISRFFEKHGFTLYPNAYSEYALSKHSISSILNFEATTEPHTNFKSKRPYILLGNRSFEALAKRYSALHVTQSTYMDFCQESPIPIASCFTYRFDGSEWLRTAALDDTDKLNILFGMYFNLPGFFELVRKGYVRVRDAAEGVGIALPAGIIWDGRVTPIASINAFDHFRKTVLDSDPGTAHFGHIDLPHGPYVFDASCNLTGNPFGWLSHRPLHGRENTTEGRRIRYEQYFDQIRCTMTRLDRFFGELKANGKWRHATILIHGDHGSRLYKTRVLGRNQERLTRADLMDGFSALFAVRRSTGAARDPFRRSGRPRPERRPISQLLAEAMGENLPEAETNRPPRVFLEDEKTWFALPWNPETMRTTPSEAAPASLSGEETP